MSTNVSIKWKTQKVSVDVTEDDTPETFMKKIEAATNVPVAGQKVMAKGLWKSTLKPDQTFDQPFGKLKWSGAKIVMMGTPSAELAAENAAAEEQMKNKVVFLEDMSRADALKTGKVLPPGLENLGNTCYLNSTLQCLKAVPELRESLNLVQGGGSLMDPSGMLPAALRDTYTSMEHEPTTYVPGTFVSTLRRAFPQFAQTTPQGGFMQHDSDEFFNELLAVLSRKLKNPNSIEDSPHDNAIDTLFGVDLSVSMTCTESDAEAVVRTHDRLRRLQANITADISFLEAGIKLGFEGELEKHSDVLGRNAIWKLEKRISSLPRYLVVQLNRFFWKRTPESRDHQGVNCKIMKPLKFPPVLDVYDLCDSNLQKKMKIYRDAYADKELPPTTTDKEGGTDSATTAAADVDVDMEDPDVRAAMQLSLQEDGAELDTSPVGPGMPSDFRGTYELFAVVTHKGRASNSGHYMGWVKVDGTEDDWICFDDDHASECKEEDVIQKLTGGGDYHMAYMVFYRVKA